MGRWSWCVFAVIVATRLIIKFLGIPPTAVLVFGSEPSTRRLCGPST